MSFNTSGLVQIGSTIIECESISFQPNQTNESIASAGFNVPLAVVGLQQKPVFQCTTKNVDALLNYSFLVNNIATEAVNIFCQNIDASATISGKSTKYALAAGVWVIDSISMPLGAVASATFSFFPSSNGNTAPYVITEDATTPSYEKHLNWLCAGGATINGSAIVKSTGFELVIGGQVNQEHTVGSVFPTDSYLISYAPVLTINTLNSAGAVTLLGNTGKALTTGAVVTLYGVNSTGVLTNTASRTITIPSGFAHLNDRAYSQGQRLETQIIVTASYDDTNPAITVS